MPAKFGEYNGTLPTQRDFEASIDQILSVVPGARLTQTLEGKYKLVFGDSTVNPVRDPSVLAFDIDEKETRDGIAEVPIDYNERLNQIKITFANAAKNFATDTYVYPSYGSTIHRRWVAEDGGRQLRVEETMDGVKDRLHAAAIARSTIALSRRALYKFVLPKKYIVLEEGDIVGLQMFGRDKLYARILAATPTPDLMMDVVAQEYNRFDYTFWYDDQEEIPGSVQDFPTSREPRFRGDWVEGEFYIRGDWVFLREFVAESNVPFRIARHFRCIRTHYSDSDKKPGTPGGNLYWTEEALLGEGEFGFIGDVINDVIFIKGEEIETLELPEATRTGKETEEELIYTTSALPAGLVFNPATRHITGVPQNVVTFHSVTYRAILPSTQEQATETFLITVRERGSSLIPDFELTAVDVEEGDSHY